MAYTAHSDAEMMKEHFDSDEVLDTKINQLVGWIREAKHFTIFTGAGISTSAGISDFRGPQGVWTLKAQGKTSTAPYVPTTKAVPTATHMAIVELSRRQILKYLISQNCDGLHKRSGMHPDRISELHGNSNIEECETCKKQYLRDFAAHRLGHGHDHYTGRHCVVPIAGNQGKTCNGRLLEYTIDFGQNLPEVPLARAYENARTSDLCLVLGSSLTVTPAADMPKIVGRRGRLVIVNLQKTPLYKLAKLNIHGRCDTVMRAVMEKLGIDIPPFILRRKINISHRWLYPATATTATTAAPKAGDSKDSKAAAATATVSADSKLQQITKTTPYTSGVNIRVWAVDVDEPQLPATMIKIATIGLGDQTGEPVSMKSSYSVTARWEPDAEAPPATANIKLGFYGHYNEPDLALTYPLSFAAATSGGAATATATTAAAATATATTTVATTDSKAAAAAAADGGALDSSSLASARARLSATTTYVRSIDGSVALEKVHAGSGGGAADSKAKDAAAEKAGIIPAISADGVITNQYLLRFAPHTGQWTVEQINGVPEAKTVTKTTAATAAPTAAASASGGSGGSGGGGALAAISSFFGLSNTKKPADTPAPAPAPAESKIKLTASTLNKFVVVESFDAPNANGKATAAAAAAAADTKSDIKTSGGTGGSGGSGGSTAGGDGSGSAGALWGSTNLVSDMKDRPVIVCCGGIGDRKTAPAGGAPLPKHTGFISVFELDTKQWRALPPVADPNNHKDKTEPIPYLHKNRWGHTGTVVTSRPDQIFLIGGFDSDCQYADVNRYDVKSHTITECDSVLAKGLNPATDSFTPRAHHSALAIDPDTILIFGGSICQGGPYKYYNDCFTYKVSTGVWTKHLTKGDAPSPRAQHSALLIPRGGFNGHGNAMLVMGGENGTALLSDAYSLDLGNFKWTRVVVGAASAQAIPLAGALTAQIKPQAFRVTHARHSAVILPPPQQQKGKSAGSGGGGGAAVDDEANDGTIKVLVSGLQNSSETGLLVITPGQPMSLATGPWASYQWSHKLSSSPATHPMPLGQHLIAMRDNGMLIGWGGQTADKSKSNSQLVFAKLVE